MTDETNPQAAPLDTESPANTPSTDTEEALLPEYRMEDMPASLREGFVKLGWTSLMQVQARAIPYILANRDMMIQSRTGSGKTGAYLVPILQRINPELNATQALVLTPTRELASQVIHEAETLGSAMNVRSVAVYGGVGYGAQLEAFRQGAHLVVGTPGRILDHLLRRSMNLDKLKILVFDEADRMLSMGFYPDMKRVQRYLPRQPFNSYMFSATFPPRVLSLANEFLYRPEMLNLSSDHVHVTEVEHVFYNVPAMDKERSLIRIIESENPASAIIFCNTRERVHFVAVILQRYGYNAAEISSDLSQAAREQVMEQIRQGALRFLVATDVASRGIDIPDLSHVFLYESPEDPESYIHRAGRTGRAGSSGVAISLVNALERVELSRIAKRFEIDLQERQLPSEEEVQALVAQRTEAILESMLRERDRLKTERMQRFLPILRSLGDDEESLNGIAMLLDDFYHEHFHASQTPQPTGKPFADSGPASSHDAGAGSRKNRHERKPGGGRQAVHTGGQRERQSLPSGESTTQPDTSKTSEEPARRRRRRGGRGRSKPAQNPE